MGAQVSVSVLGPLEVHRDTKVLPIAGLKRRQLLAVLTAARGDVVSVDRLCEALWDSDPPRSARASLQSHLSRLRGALRPSLPIDSGPAGYALDLRAVDLDAAHFEWLTGERDAHDRVETLREALAMWRGTAFGEFAELPGVRGEALRLEELRLTATENWIEARLDTSTDTEVVGELEALVTDHPLRERFWLQLMIALHHNGRQADALRRCATLRTMLRDELGLDLSPAATQLEARILANDLTLRPALDSTPSRPRPPQPVRDPTSLIGRDADVTEVLEALRRRRVVTICGPGGVGKTRLAMLVATGGGERFGDVVVVELAPLRNPEATTQLVARALDVEQRQHLTLESTVEEFLADRDLLVVLDNCEHIVGAVAALVERWSRRCANVRVLATGREPLGLPGEHVHVLSPLAVPAFGVDDIDDIVGAAAVELFVDRAGDARPGYRLDQRDAAAVAEICRRLDGLPLAIELAAARMRTLGPDALARRLDQRFALLAGQRKTVDRRHRTLHHLVEWSYELLDPGEQAAFTQLSVFAGSFELDAVEAVCGTGADDTAGSVGLLMNLVDKSMVQLVDPDEPRYGLLETLREFGHDRLRATEGLCRLEARHRRWYVDLAERAAAGLEGVDESRWSDRVDRELDNLRAAHVTAVGSGDIDGAARLVVALREYAFRRIRYEVTTWAETTARMDGFAAHPLAPLVLGVSAYGRWVRGDIEAAVELALRSLGGARTGQQSSGLAERVLGNALFYRGNTGEALDWMEQMVAAARAGGSLSNLAHAQYMKSVARTCVGDTAGGAELAAEALASAERCGSPTARAHAAYAHGLALRADDTDGAERELRRSADLGCAAGNRWIQAFALTEVHWLTAHRGQTIEGLRGFAEVIDTWHRGGDWANQWLSMRHVFGILIRLDAHHAAAVLHGALVAVGAAYALPFEPADAERLAAEVDRLRGLLDPAEFAAAVRTGAAMRDTDIVAHVHAEIERLTTPSG